MGITDREFERLLHDLKRIEKVIEIIVSEKNDEKRRLIGDLLRNEFDRLFEDVEEVRADNKGDKNETNI